MEISKALSFGEGSSLGDEMFQDSDEDSFVPESLKSLFAESEKMLQSSFMEAIENPSISDENLNLSPTQKGLLSTESQKLTFDSTIRLKDKENDTLNFFSPNSDIMGPYDADMGSGTRLNPANLYNNAEEARDLAFADIPNLCPDHGDGCNHGCQVNLFLGKGIEEMNEDFTPNLSMNDSVIENDSKHIYDEALVKNKELRKTSDTVSASILLDGANENPKNENTIEFKEKLGEGAELSALDAPLARRNNVGSSMAIKALDSPKVSSVLKTNPLLVKIDNTDNASQVHDNRSPVEDESFFPNQDSLLQQNVGKVSMGVRKQPISKSIRERRSSSSTAPGLNKHDVTLSSRGRVTKISASPKNLVADSNQISGKKTIKERMSGRFKKRQSIIKDEVGLSESNTTQGRLKKMILPLSRSRGKISPVTTISNNDTTSLKKKTPLRLANKIHGPAVSLQKDSEIQRKSLTTTEKGLFERKKKRMKQKFSDEMRKKDKDCREYNQTSLSERVSLSENSTTLSKSIELQTHAEHIDFAVDKICKKSTNEILGASNDATSTLTSLNEPSCPLLLTSKDSMLSTDEKCVENVQLSSTANPQVLPNFINKVDVSLEQDDSELVKKITVVKDKEESVANKEQKDRLVIPPTAQRKRSLSKFSPTVPKSPKMHTQLRRGDRTYAMVGKRDYSGDGVYSMSSNSESLHNSSKQSSSPKKLTVPRGPRLSTLEKYGEKPCPTNSNTCNAGIKTELNMDEKLTSESKDLLTTKDVSKRKSLSKRRLTVPKSPKMHTQLRRGDRTYAMVGKRDFDSIFDSSRNASPTNRLSVPKVLELSTFKKHSEKLYPVDTANTNPAQNDGCKSLSDMQSNNAVNFVQTQYTSNDNLIDKKGNAISDMNTLPVSTSLQSSALKRDDDKPSSAVFDRLQEGKNVKNSMSFSSAGISTPKSLNLSTSSKKVPTVPVPFQFHQSKRSIITPSTDKRDSMTFTEISERFLSKKFREDYNAKKSKFVPRVTRPISPKFSASRIRKQTPAMSTEDEMVSYRKAHPFRARQVSTGAGNVGDLGIPKVPKKALTVTKPFHFVSDERAATIHLTSKKEVEPSRKSSGQFDINYSPNTSSEKMSPSQPKTEQRRKKTSPRPFNLSSNETVKRRSLLSTEKHEEQNSLKTFQARPVPNFSYKQPKSTIKKLKLTIPKPFQVSLRNTDKSLPPVPSAEELQATTEASKRMSIRARPLPDTTYKPPKMREKGRKVTTPKPFNVSTRNSRRKSVLQSSTLSPDELKTKKNDTKSFRALPLPDMAYRPRKLTPNPSMSNNIKLSVSQPSPSLHETEIAKKKLNSFRARPLPELTYKPPKAFQARALTSPKPFNVSSRVNHKPELKSFEQNEDEKFRARPMPDLTYKIPTTSQPNMSTSLRRTRVTSRTDHKLATTVSSTEEHDKVGNKAPRSFRARPLPNLTYKPPKLHKRRELTTPIPFNVSSRKSHRSIAA